MISRLPSGIRWQGQGVRHLMMVHQSPASRRPADKRQLRQPLIASSNSVWLKVSQTQRRLRPTVKAQRPGAEPELTQTELTKLAKAFGRRGGLKGGPARAAKLTPEQRRQSASNAATERWKKHLERQ